MLTPDEQKGRVALSLFISGMLILSAATIGSYVALKGPERLPIQIARFLLTAGLLRWLYRGSPVAKWIMIISCSSAGLYFLMVAFRGKVLVLKLGAGMAMLYFTFAITLLTSSNISSFLFYQRFREHRDRDLDVE